jgi:hypothetical protein
MTVENMQGEAKVSFANEHRTDSKRATNLGYTAQSELGTTKVGPIMLFSPDCPSGPEVQTAINPSVWAQQMT